ncbi:hypothetical protein ACFV16_33985 [Streptomyces massasporeus]|uniref:hypothetical protein n=1 Tax=Streptomyces massasporeus TaxID=67324 RepID=UPI0036984F70
MRAVELFEEGGSSAAIARAVGVWAESVRRWRRVWEVGGVSALAACGHRWPAPAGRRPGRDCPGRVGRGAQAYGFEAGLWTLERVGAVVAQVTCPYGLRQVVAILGGS